MEPAGASVKAHPPGMFPLHAEQQLTTPWLAWQSLMTMPSSSKYALYMSWTKRAGTLEKASPNSCGKVHRVLRLFALLRAAMRSAQCSCS
jgi:hypothetical protein